MTDQVREMDETNNCIDRTITVEGAPVHLLVTAGCITLPPYSLLDVPVAYQVKDPMGTVVETGTKKTPFTLSYPQGFQVLLDAPDTHDLHRLQHWRLGSEPPSYVLDPAAVIFDPGGPAGRGSVHDHAGAEVHGVLSRFPGSKRRLRERSGLLRAWACWWGPALPRIWSAGLLRLVPSLPRA